MVCASFALSDRALDLQHFICYLRLPWFFGSAKTTPWTRALVWRVIFPISCGTQQSWIRAFISVEFFVHLKWGPSEVLSNVYVHVRRCQTKFLNDYDIFPCIPFTLIYEIVCRWCCWLVSWQEKTTAKSDYLWKCDRPVILPKEEIMSWVDWKGIIYLLAQKWVRKWIPEDRSGRKLQICEFLKLVQILLHVLHVIFMKSQDTGLFPAGDKGIRVSNEVLQAVSPGWSGKRIETATSTVAKGVVLWC